MPSYEVMALFRTVGSKPELASCVKRVAQELINQGTLIRRIESLGERKLAFKIRDIDKKNHERAHYIIYHVNSHYDNITTQVKGVMDRDLDVIRFGFHQDEKFDHKPDFNCIDPLWHQDSPFERF